MRSGIFFAGSVVLRFSGGVSGSITWGAALPVSDAEKDFMNSSSSESACSSRVGFVDVEAGRMRCSSESAMPEFEAC